MTEQEREEVRRDWPWLSTIWRMRLARLVHGDGTTKSVSAEMLLLFDLVRDQVVLERALSWISMPRSERHLVYKIVGERLLCSIPGEDPDACEAFALIMMFRDDVHHAEREVFPAGSTRKEALDTARGLRFPYPRP